MTVTNIAGENIAGEKVEGEYRITSGQHVNALPVAAFHSPADREKMPELEPLWGRLVVGWRYIAITLKIPPRGRANRRRKLVLRPDNNT